MQRVHDAALYSKPKAPGTPHLPARVATGANGSLTHARVDVDGRLGADELLPGILLLLHGFTNDRGIGGEGATRTGCGNGRIDYPAHVALPSRLRGYTNALGGRGAVF